MGNDYHFVTVWKVQGTTAEVAAVLRDGEALPRWWPSVYLDVHLVEKGDADDVGTSLDLYTKGWLPYTLRWKLTVTEPITESGFALTATGDLIGAGRWAFEQAGSDVVITYDWRVSPSKPLLRRLSWILKPAFSANHHWAMKRGEESLQLELRRRRPVEAEPEPIPPPPPPTFRRLARPRR